MDNVLPPYLHITPACTQRCVLRVIFVCLICRRWYVCPGAGVFTCVSSCVYVCSCVCVCIHVCVCVYDYVLAVSCAKELVKLHDVKPALCPFCRRVIMGFTVCKSGAPK